MQVIFLSYSRLVRVVEEYFPLKTMINEWMGTVSTDNKKQYYDNSGKTEQARFDRVVAFLNNDFTTLKSKVDQVFTTLEYASRKTAGLLCTCEMFPEILRGGDAEKTSYWVSCGAAPTLDFLFLEDEACNIKDYNGSIKDNTENVIERCNSQTEEIGLLRETLNGLQITNVSVDGYITTVEDCNTKELRTETLYTSLKDYVLGVKVLENVVESTLSPLVDEESKEFHTRIYKYDGESTDNKAFIRRAVYRSLGYTDEQIDSETAQGIRWGAVDEAFVKITDVTDGYNYGGDQSWFRIGLFEDLFQNGTIINHRTDYNGCGVIAAVNMYLYMTGHTSVTKAEFVDLVRDFYDANDYGSNSDKIIQSSLRRGAVKGPTGATPQQIQDYIYNMCSVHNMNVQAVWDWTAGYETDYDDLKNQLGQGIPVVWAMFDWNNGVNPLAKDVVPYYTYDDTTNTYDVAPEKGAASHYVVATGLYEKVNDDGSVKRTVEISTWGRKRYVDYDEYVNFVSGTGENCFFSSITNTTLN